MTESRAAVFFGSGQPMQIRSFPMPSLQAGEVLIRVTCCTLCGSDLHAFQGHRPSPTPTILGHEIIGRVEVMGRDGVVDVHGVPLEVGDRVTWSIVANCGSCFYCRHEIPQKCERLFKYGHEPISNTRPLSGGLAEHCQLAPGTAIVRLADELQDAVACPANCATATVAAALRVGGGCDGKTVLIQGAGMLGLTACAMTHSAGASDVVVCDVDPQRLRLAKRFGATQSIVVDENAKLREIVKQITSGRGVDLAIELCGATGAVETALPLLRIGACYVLVGAVFPAPPFSASAEFIVRRLLTIRGLHNYTPQDLVTAVDFLSQNHHRFPFSELIVDTFPLQGSEQAFQHAIATRAWRVAVIP